jgi:hypothetical protein
VLSPLILGPETAQGCLLVEWITLSRCRDVESSHDDEESMIHSETGISQIEMLDQSTNLVIHTPVSLPISCATRNCRITHAKIYSGTSNVHIDVVFVRKT